MLELNFDLAERVIVSFIRDAVFKHGFKRGILGVSGGIDSAVVLALVAKALGNDNTFALLMPYSLSTDESIIHGKQLCDKYGVKYEVVDISPSVSAYFDRFPTKDKVLIGNKCARERMSVLYDFSARQKAMVVGTSNKSELLIGYSTLYGDSAAAFLPIGDLYKTQVFGLARHLGIPDDIINKPPSADLWPDQTDEGEIGMTYRKLDEILFQMVDLRLGREDIVKKGYKKAAVETVQRKIIGSQFKRTMPPVAKLLHRTVGIDFRYLRDWDK